MPGLLGRDTAAGRSVPAFAARESDGFVWVWARVDAEPVGAPPRIPRIDDPDYFVVIREYDVECTMHAALENALDVPHTAFVHRGDFRGKEPREIEAVRRRIPNGIEVEYLGEPPLSGPTHDPDGQPILSEHWDRFFLPSLAQVEYKTSSGRHLINTLPHTPVGDSARFWLVSCWNVRRAARRDGADHREDARHHSGSGTSRSCARRPAHPRARRRVVPLDRARPDGPGMLRMRAPRGRIADYGADRAPCAARVLSRGMPGDLKQCELPSGVSLAYRDEGAGEPLILIHGITEDHRAWDVFMPELTRHSRVIRLDLHGHGASSPLPEYSAAALVEPVAQLVQSLALERPRVVGHSLGGLIATLLGALVPVRSIVNVDQPLRLGTFIERVRRIAPALEGPQFTAPCWNAEMEELGGRGPSACATPALVERAGQSCSASGCRSSSDRGLGHRAARACSRGSRAILAVRTPAPTTALAAQGDPTARPRSGRARPLAAPGRAGVPRAAGSLGRGELVRQVDLCRPVVVTGTAEAVAPRLGARHRDVARARTASGSISTPRWAWPAVAAERIEQSARPMSSGSA